MKTPCEVEWCRYNFPEVDQLSSTTEMHWIKENALVLTKSTCLMRDLERLGMKRDLGDMGFLCIIDSARLQM